MAEVALRAEGLSKQYRIGGPQKSFDRLGEQVVDWVAAPFRRSLNLVRGHAYAAADLEETIWALEEVSFEIKHGEAVGIIGRNGAGKSTLLKILSRITEPTSGYADIFGRVGSLLEVGTGFHPELTGRENVYLNGAILGMKKTEIDQKFDEIVSFAEIEKFIDTPVKHYSSGMYVRLAFSVAAYLDPEILLVDEVLAVGDVAFQRKCLGKMDDVAHQGRTVLFVSHNMGLMQSLCTRGIYLDDGKIHTDGSIRESVDAYLQSIERQVSLELTERTDRIGQGNIRLIRMDITNGSSSTPSILRTGGSAQFTFQVDRTTPDLHMNFSIFDQIGQPVLKFDTKDHSPKDGYNPISDNTFVCEIEQLPILPGRYRLDVGIIGHNRLQDYVIGAGYIDVEEGSIDERVLRNREKYNITIPYKWTLPRKGR